MNHRHHVYETLGDAYAVLRVQRNASHAEIVKAFRRLARELHPDANRGDVKREEQFKKVTLAYEILGNPSQRKEYDQWQAFQRSSTEGSHARRSKSSSRRASSSQRSSGASNPGGTPSWVWVGGTAGFEWEPGVQEFFQRIDDDLREAKARYDASVRSYEQLLRRSRAEREAEEAAAAAAQASGDPFGGVNSFSYDLYHDAWQREPFWQSWATGHRVDAQEGMRWGHQASSWHQASGDGSHSQDAWSTPSNTRLAWAWPGTGRWSQARDGLRRASRSGRSWLTTTKRWLATRVTTARFGHIPFSAVSARADARWDVRVAARRTNGSRPPLWVEREAATSRPQRPIRNPSRPTAHRSARTPPKRRAAHVRGMGRGPVLGF